MKIMKALVLTLVVSTPAMADKTAYDKITVPIYMPLEMCMPQLAQKDVIVNCVSQHKEYQKKTAEYP